VRQTWFALQKYHSALVAAKAVGKEQIEIAYLLGNPALSRFVLAVSIGAVFFGAKYLHWQWAQFHGQGHRRSPKSPHSWFPRYIFNYALPCMGPVLLLIWWIFFSRSGLIPL